MIVRHHHDVVASDAPTRLTLEPPERWPGDCHLCLLEVLRLMFDILPATPGDLPEIDMLLDAGFGVSRHGLTAYRLRAGASPDPTLSFVARDGAALLGSVQCWPIRLGNAAGQAVPLVLLGPIAVAGDRRGEGIASALMAAALAGVDATGARPVLLVGDAAFYGRFGFSNAATQGWQMPGPIDQARLLLRWSGAALPLVARVEPAAAALRAA